MINPFQQIDKSKFPSSKHNHEKRKDLSVDPLPQTTDEDIDDQVLFLRAMSNVSKQHCRKHQISQTSSFTLNEQVIFQRKDGNVPQKSLQKEGPPQQEARNDAESDASQNDFLDAMQEVIPLAGNGRSVSPTPDRKKAPQIAQDLMASFMEGKLEFALSNTKEYCEGYVVGLDEMTMNKLRAGALSPEAHLDLHGLNTVQAFEAMRNFMRGSWYKSLRTVLIIPGRGQNSPNGIGILRSKVQDWLTQEPFKRVVLAFCTAQQLDGGLGSMYVLLRKYKKKGRVYWERTPNDADLNELV